MHIWLDNAHLDHLICCIIVMELEAVEKHMCTECLACSSRRAPLDRPRSDVVPPANPRVSLVFF